MITFTPDPIAFQLGPIPVYWYGIGYAAGLAAAYLVLVREARRMGQDPNLVGNGMILVAIAALIGGRAYHVIDQWDLYKDDLARIVLPPYSGLGVYGGLATGLVTVVVYARLKRVPFWTWADIIAPALFVMQGIGRLGNFFNQELYGTPTTLPWGIAIDCQHRIAAYPCDLYPFASTFFQPLFLYESLSGFLGAATLLWIGRRFRDRLRPGDLIIIFFVWYGIVRFLLEPLRSDNWLIGGIPAAQIASLVFIGGALLAFALRHRPGWRDEAAAERAHSADTAETLTGDPPAGPSGAALSPDIAEIDAAMRDAARRTGDAGPGAVHDPPSDETETGGPRAPEVASDDAGGADRPA